MAQARVAAIPGCAVEAEAFKSFWPAGGRLCLPACLPGHLLYMLLSMKYLQWPDAAVLCRDLPGHPQRCPLLASMCVCSPCPNLVLLLTFLQRSITSSTSRREGAAGAGSAPPRAAQTPSAATGEAQSQLIVTDVGSACSCWQAPKTPRRRSTSRLA